MTLALDSDLLDQTERYDVSRKARISHPPEGVTKSLFIKRRHVASNMLAECETDKRSHRGI